MTLPIERSRPRRPVTWITLIGALLLPVLIGGVLVAALYNPVERLDAISAAIVNDDEPVTVDGQTVPLGRLLTSGLVEGSDDVASNLDWTLTNAADARSGLKDGTYTAVVTIPAGFSAAATSTAPGGDPRQATIDVQTAPDARVVDEAISAQITSTAASVLGRQLSATYLQNVFLGFTTLGDRLGDAADGAGQLASGAKDASTGATSLADGVRQLSSGAAGLSSGLTSWADGANGAAAGLGDWAAHAKDLAGGTQQLAGGLSQISAGFSQLQVPQEIVDAVGQVAQNSEQAKQSVSDAAAQLAALSQTCIDQGGSAELCDGIAAAAQRADDALPQLNSAIDQAGTVAAGLQQLPQAAAGLQAISSNLDSVAGGMNGLADGATDAAAGVAQLAAGAQQLAGGGAALANGATDAATGADGLASGLTTLSTGTQTLADGLVTATDQLPRYTDDQAKTLADVVADPVAAEGNSSSLFGATAVPLLAAAALWFGGLATFVALQAVSRRALVSRAASAALAGRALWPAAAIGALQGVLVAAVVQWAAGYDAGTWWAFAGLCVLAGVAFAAVNQALNAVFGGAGRWISAIVGVMLVATGIVSTVPGPLAAIAGLLPTAPAYNGMVSALTGTAGSGAAVIGMVVWIVLAFLATVLAIARRRTTSARAVLNAAPTLG